MLSTTSVEALQVPPQPQAATPPADCAQRDRARALWDDAQRLSRAPETSPATLALLHAEGARAARAAAPGALVTEAELELLARADDVHALRALHERLLTAAEAELRHARQAAQARLYRLGLGAFVLALAVVLASWTAIWLARPKNLAAGKPWRTSSKALDCTPAKHSCGGTRTDIFFHTDNEPEPWFEVDLEAPTDFSGLTVRNRMDMGVDRAVPLVAEVSDDRASWKEIARRPEPFLDWEPRFAPVKARYLRLRVLKKTWFHLEAVEVHP